MKNIFARIQKFAIAGILSSLVAGAVLLVPSLNVFAAADLQTATPPAPQATQPAPVDPTARLAQRYQDEQTWLTTQGKNLDRANALTARAQQVIDNFKSRGVDVLPLQTALDNFKDTLPAATQVHNTASAILSAHDGFDAAGAVTDPAAARSTVQSAAQSLRQARQILSAAVKDLRAEIKTFRQQHKANKPAPSATPTVMPGASS